MRKRFPPEPFLRDRMENGASFSECFICKSEDGKTVSGGCIGGNRCYSMNIMKILGLKKILFLFVAAGMASLLTSCYYFEMNRNTKNLAKIRKGMTRKQVIEVMGEPVSGEIYCSDKVIYYYTRQRWMDGMVTRDECTPIAFDEYDKVIGWGPDFQTGVYDFLANPNPIEKNLKKE